MASYLDKFQIKTAVPKKQKFDMSCQHITTADFMQLAPVYSKELVPGESVSVNMETFTRMAALAVPTFGRLNIHNRAFFVPFRTIFKGWNDFITDTIHVNGANGAAILPKVPTVSNYVLSSVFFRSQYNGTPTSGSVQTTDFGTIYSGTAGPAGVDNFTIADGRVIGLDDAADVVVDMLSVSDTRSMAIKLNNHGRQALKVLNSLGYQIVFNDDQAWDTVEYSALPILAYLKVYLDWYWPSAWYDDAERYNLQKLLEIDNYTTNKQLSIEELYSILNFTIRVNYDSDYFTSAFQNPVGPSTGAYSSNFQISDVTSYSNDTQSLPSRYNTVWNGNRAGSIITEGFDNGTPFIAGRTSTSVQSPNVSFLSQYALDALKSLTDYMKRHQLVGARALDRYMARFGINLKSDKLDRSIYIGSDNVPVQIGDVMSQSSTEGAALGDYAGKGLGYGGSSFDFETDEYGIFIIMSSIVPTIGYYQGIDRNVMHISKLDYYTPEFDQLGTQAIKGSEVYVNSINGTAAVNGYADETIADNVVFGFTPRYAEYKIARDRLTGDWRVNSLNQAGDTSNSWHLMREFGDQTFNDRPTGITISNSFVRGMDSNQYDRIFNNRDTTADHFYLIYNFDIASWSPMKRLYDTYEFDSDGKDVTLDVNGVKVN